MKIKYTFAFIFAALFLSTAHANFIQIQPDFVKPINVTKPKDIPWITNVSVAPSGSVTRDKTGDPLVVVVHGLDSGEIGFILEFKHIKFLLGLISSSPKSVRSGMTMSKARGIIAENAAFEANVIARHKDYAERMLHQAKKITNIDAEIIKFEWSRDPGDTYQVIRRMKKELMEVYEQAEAQNRPLHIVAFSWGSVIMYEVLAALYEEERNVYVDKFITLGSPLMPSGFLTQVFLFIEIIKEQLSVYIYHPKNVKQWVNLYADNDGFSGLISYADSNVKVDEPALSVIEQVKNYTGPDYKAQKADLKTIRGTMLWHMSYFYNINVPLKSIGTTYRQDLVTQYAPLYLAK